MNNGETWMERNDTVKEREEHRQMWGCSAPAAFILAKLLIIRHPCEIAIYDLQAHFPVFVQMLSVIQAMLLYMFSVQRTNIQYISIKINKNYNYIKGKITGVISFVFAAKSDFSILF